MAIPENEGGRRMIEVRRDVGGAVLMRTHCLNLRRKGINAFPILESRRQIGNVFPSGTTPDTALVLEVVLRSMPIPDDQTLWEDIIEFRNDPESRKRLPKIRARHDRNVIS
jgi:hypothetical protein